MSKVVKILLSVLVTKLVTDVAMRAAHNPQVGQTVSKWTSTIVKKVAMAIFGAIFFSTGLVLTIMSIAGSLDRALPIVSYRSVFALFIFFTGLFLLIAASYKRPKPVTRYREPDLISSALSSLVESRGTRP